MTYYINNDCIVCGKCEPECPVEAISPGAKKYVIDPKYCRNFAVCVEVCPVGAIHRVEEDV